MIHYLGVRSKVQALIYCGFLGLVIPYCAVADIQKDEVLALKKQIDEERKRLDALEKKLHDLIASGTSSPPVRSEISEEVAKVIVKRDDTTPVRQLMAAEGRSDPYLDEKFNKSIPLVGSPWRFSFGGYAKVDVIHDFSGTGNKRQLVLGQIPVDDDPSEGSYSQVQISETRFHLETRNSDSPHENSLFLEFDFFDENSPNSTRLRHAYVRYGKLLVGQTWTLLSELRQLPLILDFAAGDSILGGRTEQIRWTIPSEDKTFGWAVALENFNDASIYNPDGLTGKARSDFPRLSSGFTKLWDRLEWSTGASVTQLRFDGADGVGDSEELAYTATTAGRFYLDGNKNNWFGFGFGYQSGSINDVITFANAGVPNAAIDSDGSLDLAKGWNTQLGLHWVWNQSLSSNFSYAYTDMTDVPDAFDPDWIKSGAAVHANLIYKYDKQLSVGVELMHAERENVSGRDGDSQRIQFSTIYYY